MAHFIQQIDLTFSNIQFINHAGGLLLPATGIAYIDVADADNTNLVTILCHEFIHVLGFGTLWGLPQFLNLIIPASPNNLYVGPNALLHYNILFGRQSLGVPLENNGTSGTQNSHWEEDVFNNELMTGFLNSGSNPISTVTIGAIADLGYSVDYSVATYTVPQAAALVGGLQQLPQGSILALTNEITVG